MKNAAISERKNQSISRGVGMTTQIYADRAENSRHESRTAACIDPWRIQARSTTASARKTAQRTRVDRVVAGSIVRIQG